MDASPDLPPQNRVPIFNMPGVVTASIGVLVGLHALREFVLPDTWDIAALIDLALIRGAGAWPSIRPGRRNCCGPPRP